MSGIEARRSWRGSFEKLDILPVSYQYILSLMLCVIDNQNNFYTCSKVLRLNTRKKINFTSLLQIFILFRRESLTQELRYLIECPVKYIYIYTYIFHRSIFCLSIRKERVHFSNKLCKYLVINSFYSIIDLQ